MCIRDRHRLFYYVIMPIIALAAGWSVYTIVFRAPIHNDTRAELKREVEGETVSYTHLRAHVTVLDLVCRLLLEKKNGFYSFKDDQEHILQNVLHGTDKCVIMTPGRVKSK